MFGDILVSLAAAFIITVVFAIGTTRTGPWPGLALFFIIVFLAAWSGGVWVSHIGPTLFGVSWLPFIIVGLVIALTLAWVLPRRQIYATQAGPQPPEEKETIPWRVSDYFDLISWLIMIVLIALIIMGYLRQSA